MMNKNLKKKMNVNMEFSEKLCEVLNKDDGSNSREFYACALFDAIGVRQILDTRGLAYNEVYFADEVIDEYSLAEIVNMVLENLDKGGCKTVFPAQKAIELYDKLKINGWLEEDIMIEEGDFYIKEIAWSSIDTMECIKINRDIIKIMIGDNIDNEALKVTIERGMEANIEKVKVIPFNIIFNDEEEGKLVRCIDIGEIDFRTSIGKIYSKHGKLYYKDEFGDGVVCDLDKLIEINYVANKNIYMVGATFEENIVEYVHFNQYGLEM